MKKLPNSQLEFELEISPDEAAVYLDNAAKEISKDIEIKGFRKGKAPRDVLEKMVGKQAIFEEAGRLAIEKKYEEFLRRNDIFAVDYPKMDVKKMAEGNPIIVNVIVSVYPEIKLPDYKKISKDVVKKREKNITVEDKEIEETISQIQNSRAKEVSVKREVKEDDIAEVNFEVRLDGVKIEGGDSKNHPVKIGGGKFIEGFEDNVKGMKAGDEKKFKLKAPKSYFKKELAGKELEFSVKLNNVIEVSLPELNDEFVSSLGNFKTIEDLKKNIRDGMKKEKEAKEKEEFRNSLVGEIAKESRIELPEIMIKKEVDKMLKEMEMGIKQHGLDFETYLLSIKKTEEDLKNDMKPQAELRIKSAMIIEEIAKQEEIKAGDDEVTEKINEILLKYKDLASANNAMDPGRLKAYSQMMIINEKVLNLLEKTN